MVRRTARRTRTAAVVFAAAGAVAAAPVQAVAAPQDAPRDGARHCIADLRTGAQECFGTFTEAVEAASGGRIDDAPASARSAAQDPAFRKRTKELATAAETARNGDLIQGTLFEHENYGGATFTVYGEAPCPDNGKVDYSIDLPDDWKDIVTSVQPWANCWIWLYPEPGLNGDRDGPFKENTPYVGSFMNDRTESVGFS
ncbi:hypothetical protein [Streptomyces carminius]|uniref:hypothetical protein n=1 Tax=Streptomyces carminius TaxID=2665496 RepID=UPI001E2BC1C3|nr:hypothetical protein [Streptomyces carminius]